MDSTDLTLINNVKVINTKELEIAGKKIYHSNDFMRKLSNLIEHPEYAEFLKEHFDSWENIQVFMMFYKVYERLTSDFPDLNGYQKISLLHSLISTSKTRQLVCKEIRDSFNSKKSVKPVKALNIEKTSIHDITEV